MSIDSTTAIARITAGIADLSTAVSLNRCEKLHAGVTGYCQALLDCGVITECQWQQLSNLADAELSAWMPAPDFGTRLPGWQAKDYE
jgi:hypothetical protein